MSLSLPEQDAVDDPADQTVDAHALHPQGVDGPALGDLDGDRLDAAAELQLEQVTVAR